MGLPRCCNLAGRDRALNDGEKHSGYRPPIGKKVPLWTRVLSKLFSWTLIGLGLILLASGVLLGLGQLAVLTSWPVAEAQVTSSRVLYQDGSYQPEAEFRYTVDGRQYVARTLLVSGLSGYPHAKGIADRYSPGTRHAIRYDARRPEQIVANAGYTLNFFRRPFLVVVMGGIVLFLGWWLFLRTRAAPRKLSPAQTWLVVGAFIGAVGTVFLAIGSWKAYTDYRVVKTWPAADAQVESNRVRRYYRSTSKTSGTYNYQVIVEFRYVAEGRELVSPSAEDFNFPHEAEQERARFAPGSRHEIRYNPADPNEIRFNVNPADFSMAMECIFPGMGLLFAAIGAAVVYLSRARGTQTTISSAPHRQAHKRARRQRGPIG